MTLALFLKIFEKLNRYISTIIWKTDTMNHLTSVLSIKYHQWFFFKIQDEKYISFFGIKRIKGRGTFIAFSYGNYYKWYWTSVNLLKREALSKIFTRGTWLFFSLWKRKRIILWSLTILWLYLAIQLPLKTPHAPNAMQSTSPRLSGLLTGSEYINSKSVTVDKNSENICMYISCKINDYSLCFVIRLFKIKFRILKDIRVEIWLKLYGTNHDTNRNLIERPGNRKTLPKYLILNDSGATSYRHLKSKQLSNR